MAQPLNTEAVGPLSNLWWPSPLPGSSLVYSFSLVDPIFPEDYIVAASIATAPSGAGELQASNIVILGTTLFVTLTAGQPCRQYRNNLLLTGASGQTWEYVVNIVVSPQTGVTPPPTPPAPSPNFGAPVEWTPSVNLSLRRGAGTEFLLDTLGNFYVDPYGNILEINNPSGTGNYFLQDIDGNFYVDGLGNLVEV